ncbi:MAG TPA: MotA/TolQ/ExbB proton channel family protein, partial [Variovorax sp.]
MNVVQLLAQGDGVSRSVAALLLLMSVASWIAILLKAWLLRGGTRAVLRSIAAFWQAPSIIEAEQGLRAFDGPRLVLPAVVALRALAADKGGAT